MYAYRVQIYALLRVPDDFSMVVSVLGFPFKFPGDDAEHVVTNATDEMILISPLNDKSKEVTLCRKRIRNRNAKKTEVQAPNT